MSEDTTALQARRRHYGTFYGEDPLGDGLCALAWGNCQAESLRVALGAHAGRDATGIRVPPVHELVAADLPFVERALGRADVLVAQPVRAGYRGLPLGTEEVTRLLRPGVPVIRVPIVRYFGLFPYQLIVHDPRLRDLPMVPYLDVRTLADPGNDVDLHLADTDIVAGARASLAELRRRQDARGLIAVDDAVRELGAAAMNTANHPANPVLLTLAGRVRARLGLPAVALDPGRELLRSVFAPLERHVVAALGHQAPPREHWIIDGVEIEAGEVRSRQGAWLQDRPGLLRDLVTAHRPLVDRLTRR